MGLGILYLLIPVTLTLAGAALALFFWAVRSGQFDDLETPAHRMFLEDDEGPAAAEADGASGQR